MFYTPERALMNRTEHIPVQRVCAHTYQRTIGLPRRGRWVFNGVTAKEFAPLVTADDATDVARR